jgi:hypothetical protein
MTWQILSSLKIDHDQGGGSQLTVDVFEFYWPIY